MDQKIRRVGATSVAQPIRILEPAIGHPTHRDAVKFIAQPFAQILEQRKFKYGNSASLVRDDLVRL